jgi:hypothetical protein
MRLKIVDATADRGEPSLPDVIGFVPARKLKPANRYVLPDQWH